MQRLTPTAHLAAVALTAACGPTDSASHRPPAGALHDGYLGSGNRHDSVTARKGS